VNKKVFFILNPFFLFFYIFICEIYKHFKGPARVRDELLPYLIEIIEELDNDDEFLLKMSE
jgi:hypothetical protein